MNLDGGEDGFARVATGRERRAAWTDVRRHRHRHPYAAIVLAGGYEESGNGGRHRVGPGTVLLHGAFDAHLDRFDHRGADILNLTLDTSPTRSCVAGRIADPDAVMRLWETDHEEAQRFLLDRFLDVPAVATDWPDLLANDLLTNPDISLEVWARAHSLTPETLSRRFGRLFAVTPAAFRHELRALRAFDAIEGSDESFAHIAANEGFSDQAHMTRAISRLTGSSPGRWRSNRFKTTRN